MLRNNNNINHTKFSLVTVIGLMLAACAHQSKVLPSQGHIDGKANTQSTSQIATVAPIPKLVRSAPILPPPKATSKAQTYSVVVNEVPVKEILFALARESKLNIDIHPSIQGRATLNAVDQTLPAILERLARQVDLTYKMENGVLYIAPDSPVLKTYQINYVNMNRDTTGEISVSNAIASGESVSGEKASLSDNTSKTKVTTVSENHYWDSLIKNIQDILQESDKEVLIGKIASKELSRDDFNTTSVVRARGNGAAGTNASTGGALGAGNQSLDAAALATLDKEKETTTKDYKTLFAASVIPNKETGVLSVRATQRQHEKIQEFLDKIQASSKRQVLIEATIVEIKLNDRYQAGVDWSRLGKGGILNGFTFQQDLLGTALTAAPRFAIGYNKSTALGDIAASVRLLQTFGTTKVLSSPKLMVLNSQTAILKAVENLVYFTITGTPARLSDLGVVISPAVFTTTPHTIPVGIWMSVTPQVNENGTVTMNVRPTISRQSGEIEDPNPSLKPSKDGLTAGIRSVIPQITVREMESMLQVPSGSTVILGGLMQDEITNTSNGIPGISKAPVIGNAFKARDDNTTKTELVIFLRPTVIPNASLESEELQSYKQYLPAQQLQNVLEGAN